MNPSDYTFVFGTSNNDHLTGGSRAEWFFAGRGDDIVDGNDGNDRLNGEEGNDVLNGGAGDDIIQTGDYEPGGGDDIANGGDGDDTIFAGVGHDVLTGGAGKDNFVVVRAYYAASDDVIADFSAGDKIDLTSIGVGDIQSLLPFMHMDGADTVISLKSNGFDQTITVKGVELASLTSASFIYSPYNSGNYVTSSQGSDTVFGGTGGDHLYGYGGDVLVGGAGNDTYIITQLGDTILEDANRGRDVVLTTIDYTLPDNVENFQATGPTGLHLTGNGLDNIFKGTLAGDVMAGGLGNDTYYVDALDTIVENAGEGIDRVITNIDYTLGANVEAITAIGSEALHLTGNALDNIFHGNGSADIMTGGAGDDTYYVDSIAVVVEDVGGGADTEVAAIDYALDANIEKLVLSGTTDLSGWGNALDNTLTGNSGANILYGMDGNDTLNGRAGADQMSGGLGNDTYYVDNAGDLVNENRNEGTDGVVSSITWQLDLNVENLTLTGTGNLSATGNTLDNVLIGNKGANVLIGGAGNDTLTGGAGNDVFVYATGFGNDTVTDFHSGDRIDVSALHIADFASLQAFLNDAGGAARLTLAYGGTAETLTLNSIAAVNLTASDFIFNTSDTALTLTGTSSRDVLFGGRGHDVIMGGGGNDELTGGAGNDILTGGAAADTFHFGHGSGDDVITDFSASEILDVSGAAGFAGYIALEQWGDDTLVRFSASDSVRLSHVTATNLSAANFRFAAGAGPNVGTAHGETVTGTTGDDIVNGLGGMDHLYGLDGNDILYGGTSADTLIGGHGNDTYFVDATGDIVTEMMGEGNDTVYSSATFTLSANVEKLVLTGSANLSAFGNAANNTLIGNEGNNKLLGGDGNDTLGGGLGNDTLDGGKGADAMKGGAGDDRYYVDNTGDMVTEYTHSGTDTVLSSISFTLGANLENLSLIGVHDLSATGNAMANTLTGNGADNVLDGGAGADTLIGGLGADLFVFRPSSGHDTVSDFSLAQGDRIDLSAYTHGTIHDDYIQQIGADTVIDLGGGNLITLVNTASGDPVFNSHIIW